MTDSQFDQIFRDKLQGFECEVDESLWDGISARLAANRRRKVFLRVVYGAVAAAACVALGLFLFNGNDVPSSQLQSAPVVAVVESVVPQELDTPGDSQDIPSIADQIKALRSGSAVAEVLPSEIIKAVESVSETSSDDVQEVVEDEVEDSKAPEQGGQQAAGQPSGNTYRTPTGTQLMDDYYLFEEEEISKRHTHSSISISSNVAGIASPDGFIYQMAPSHSASVTGRSSGIVVEELTESSYSIPLSFGVQFRYPLAEKFYLGAGVNYTYLQRNFSALVNKEKYNSVTSRLHYAGLTASAFYDFIQEGRLKVYGRAGGAVDKCLSANLIFGDQSVAQDAAGLQWSVNAGVGLEYKIANPVALFVDPSASYYFDCAQPKSIRTEQPLMFSLEAGVRFSF
ncbi:MAG: outer membrane beta-barrel protein [Bacteroidales bacterium]|nr:outer membrane beta-barrel protein [Bacteroidales bacterium]